MMRNMLLLFLTCTLVLTNLSCTDTATVDDTPFAIYYPDLTDIGPSMTGTVPAPSYIGATPSDFAITQVMLNDEPVSTTCFTIDAATGSILIQQQTETLAVGLYRLSISCMAAGQTYSYPNLVGINVMSLVPEGIRVEPDLLVIDHADLKTSEAKAQVVTEGGHVSISNYRIANEEYKDYFAVSTAGEVTINKSYQGDILPGRYTVSLVLKTGGVSTEYLFPDAVTFHITSKPLGVTYTPAVAKIESEASGLTSYTTEAPVLKGSPDEAVYSIAKITPATDKIKIDAATGILSIAEGHGFQTGEKYVVDVNIRNKYNTPDETGTVVEAAFTLEVVDFIRPIEQFAYDNISKVQATPLSIAHTDAFVGDEVTFTLEPLAAELQRQLSIDPATGIVSAKKGNTIPVGTYNIMVKATNVKGAKTATFTLTITTNPNAFTFIKYGNNLGLPVESHAYQYRFGSEADLKSFTIPAPQTDLPQGVVVKWTVTNALLVKSAKVTEQGALDFSAAALPVSNAGMILVTATAGTGDEAFSVSVPVFLHNAAAKEGVTVNYTPFVACINPQTGGSSAAPIIEGVADKSKFLMDYRRSFSYFNLGGPDSHASGTIKNDAASEHLFIAQVWRNYYTAVDKKPNYGGRTPMSYYDNQSALTTPLGYVNPTDYSVIVNPGKWIGEDGTYANGVMTGQMTFVTDGNADNVAKGKEIFPILLWFDENF